MRLLKHFLRPASLISLSVVDGSPQQAPSGAIMGWVMGPDYTSLAGVAVLVNARPDMVRAVSSFRGLAVTIAYGRLSVNRMPDATYSLRPHPPNRRLLVVPCIWTVEAGMAFASGQTAQARPIQFEAVVDLYVHESSKRHGSGGLTCVPRDTGLRT